MKEQSGILEAICQMAKDDNKGLMMSTTIVNVSSVKQGKVVGFGVDENAGNSAQLQSMGLPARHMCVAFFIDVDELQKYKNKKT